MTTRTRTDRIRDWLAYHLANAAMRLATPWYRNMTSGVMHYGLNAAVRELSAPKPQLTPSSRCVCSHTQSQHFRSPDGLGQCGDCDCEQWQAPF